MRKFWKEYANLVGMTIVGLVFAYASFYLFLNCYHYQEVREAYTYNMKEDVNYQQIQANINLIKNNIDFSIQDYKGPIDSYFISGLQSRLNMCVQELENEKLNEIAEKNSFTLKDVNSLNNLYRSHVVNNCVVLQVTDYLSLSKDKLYQYGSYKELYDASLLETKFITQNTSYLSSQLQNNSSYYFNTTASRNGVYHPVKDNLSVVLGAYEKATEYVVQVSNWLQGEVTIS